METAQGNDIMLSLYRIVPGVKSCHTLASDKSLDDLIHLKARVVTFLWIDGKRKDPIHDFWRVHRAEVLANYCHIVFTDIQHDTGWVDLEKAFGGTKFGSLFLMRVSENARPSVCPSQRGMYIK